MATFEVQVEGLTGLTIESSGTNPTQDQLSQYLKDGVIETTNRVINLRPDTAFNFQRTTSSDSQGVSVGGAIIISVMREANLDGSSDGSLAWRECRMIPPSLQSRVVDVDSLNYASIYNPVYTMDNDHTVNVYPVPSSNNAMKISYINEEPRDITNNAALVYSHSNIKYFQNDKVYLVVLYAACRSLLNAMSGLQLPNDLVIPPAPIAPTMAEKSVSITGTAPTYTKGVIAPDFGDANNWLTTEEDSEMVASRVQIISSQLQDYNVKVQEELNEFNKENAEYQAKLQKDLQDAQLAESKEGRDLQKYAQEVQSYQAKVGIEVQDYTSKITKMRTDYEWSQGRFAILMQDYNQAFGLMAPPQQQGGQQDGGR